MSALGSLVSANAWTALGTAVLAFLWQGALVGAVAWLVLACLPRRASAARHAVAAAALVGCLGAFGASVLAALGGPDVPAEADLATLGLAGAPTLDEAGALDAGTTLPHVAACCWTLGALLMGARLLLQCATARRLRRSSLTAPSSELSDAFAHLLDELGVRRAVRLFVSGLAEVPMVVGWLAPVVLVPAAAVAALPPEQLHALLAHELSHVRRRDHLWNALQALAEIVLFFHPVVWWVSHQMRVEREFCCDETSVRVTGDPRLLAEALARMESLRFLGPRTVALASQGGPLMQRITRILGVDAPSTAVWQLPAGFVLVGVAALAGSAFAGPSVEPEPQDLGAKQVQRRADEEADRRAAEVAAKKAALIADKLAVAEARIARAIEAGELTAEEGKARLEAYAKSLKDEHAPRKRTYEVALQQLREQVAAGTISQADMELRLTHYRVRLGLADTKAQLADLETAMKKTQDALAAGKLSPEEARRKLAELRTAVADSRARLSDLQARGSLAVSLKEIEAAVAEGKLSREAAAKKMEALKRRHEQAVVWAERFTTAEQQQVRRRRVPADEKDLARAIAEVEKALVTGALSTEEAREKLVVLRRRHADAREAKEAERRDQARLKLESFTADVEKAVAAGVMTREQANAKLSEAREALAERDLERRRLDEAKRRFDQQADQLARAVEAGRLTAVQAKKELEALRKNLELREKGERAPKDGPLTQAQLREAREKLQRAVVAGQLTRKEMLEKLEALEKRAVKEKAQTKDKEKAEVKSKQRRR